MPEDRAPRAETRRGEEDLSGLSPAERRAREERVLALGEPALAGSIADAIVIKDDNLFFLTAAGGDVPAPGHHGYGLYYHDCRYLSTYRLQLAGTAPTLLVSNAAQGHRAVLEMTNTDLHANGTLIPNQTIGLTWERQVQGEPPSLVDHLTFHNYSLQAIEFPVTLTFDAGFEDVFAVRELLKESLGQLEPSVWQSDTLILAYAGADGVARSTRLRFSPPPGRRRGKMARFKVRLEPRGQQTIRVEAAVIETPPPEAGNPAQRVDQPVPVPAPRTRGAEDRRYFMQVTSDSLLLNRLIDRSTVDLAMLRSHIDGEGYFAAGIPWFATLFGRDSLLTALQTLAFNPALAGQTLALLAARQGQQVDPWHDEQPGRILHELRVGELARLGYIPHTPYYGTIDATPLFLILMDAHATWTGSLAVFEALHDNVERALRWMDEFGDLDGDGYLEYERQSPKGLVNQGWKDSGDSIVHADGRLATPPIALVEVQGYSYRARLSAARLFERAGLPERAAALRAQAARLQARFNRDFWSERLGCYVLALQGDKQPAEVVSSNPGHALWAGIASAEQAHQTVERLMAPDMFNGWGIRTLSSEAQAYSPIGYHVGTVWPHDNALIAAGFRRYGHDLEALRVISGVLEAATYFEAYRLPELFSGFGREEYGVPVNYPVACHPQAWAAGAVPAMLQTCLGLEADAFERRLTITRPMLPTFVDRLDAHGVQVGEARAYLHFTRQAGFQAAVEVTRVDGELEVVIDTESQ